MGNNPLNSFTYICPVHVSKPELCHMILMILDQERCFINMYPLLTLLILNIYNLGIL